MTFRWQGKTYDTADMRRFDTGNPAVPHVYVTRDTGCVFVVRIDRLEGIEVHVAGAEEVRALADRHNIRELGEAAKDHATPVGSCRGAVPEWRALIVEDDGVSRHTLSKLLDRSGWEIACAATVAEAQAALARRPGYLILDLNLPDGLGTTLLTQVREMNLPIRVAVTTGSNDPDLLSTVRGLRPDMVFKKPVDFSDLLSWMEAA